MSPRSKAILDSSYHRRVTANPQVETRRATVLGALTAIPLIVWWAGWAPAIMSSDSIDQWNQVLTFEFVNTHPITHTASMWLVSLLWESPAMVTLAHVAATSLLLAIVARRLVQIGVTLPFAVGAVWLIAVLPMTGATTVTMWKDVPFSLAMLWVFTELLLMARDRTTYWIRWWGPIRLGVALGMMTALRPNGRLTAFAFALALTVGFWRSWKGIATMVAGIVGMGLALPAILLVVLPATDAPIEPAQVFMPDVAAVVVNDLDIITPSDLDLVTAVAPLAIYEEFYACGDSTPLLFHPRYDNQVIRDNPSDYRRLVVSVASTAPMTVLGHRWCAAEYLLSPFNRTDTFVHRPPFDIWPNTLGLARDPISDRAYDATLAMYKAAERSEIEWLTWRPAIWVLVGLVTLGSVASRRKLAPLRWVGVLYLIHLANLILTSPAHEFRYAYGLYLLALASLPLWYLVVDPDRSRLVSTGMRRAAPATDEPAGDPYGEPQQGQDDHVGVADEVPAGHTVDDEERKG